MSLALNAAPFNDESNSNDENYLSNKRKQLNHNKTQKRFPKEGFNNEKVNNVLEKIHNMSQEEDDKQEELGDFNPPPNPESSGVTKTIRNEGMSNMSNNNNQHMFRTLGRAPQPNYNDNNIYSNDINNYGDDKSIEEYYKNLLPNFDTTKLPSNKPFYNNSYNTTNSNSNVMNQDLLLKKINYMITLLEDQKDEKTNNVTEEVVLYSFLGIFIIFVIDSFVKVGKYVR